MCEPLGVLPEAHRCRVNFCLAQVAVAHALWPCLPDATSYLCGSAEACVLGNVRALLQKGAQAVGSSALSLMQLLRHGFQDGALQCPESFVVQQLC